jgi:hypothetical protein
MPADTTLNPLDALPVLYGTLPGDTPDAGPAQSLFERDLTANRWYALASCLLVGLVASLAAMPFFEHFRALSSVLILLLAGLAGALLTAALMRFTANHQQELLLPRIPHPAVLLRYRTSAARDLCTRARRDPADAAAACERLRTEWSLLLTIAPSSVGMSRVQHLGLPNPRPGQRVIAFLMLIPAGAAALASLRGPSLAPVFPVLVMLPLLIVALLQPSGGVREACTRTLERKTCPRCAYDLHGLDHVACLRGIGPKRCPECATPWPLSLPPLRPNLSPPHV